MANRLTQIAVETLEKSGNPHVRLTQVAVETLSSVAPAPTHARLTQVAVESLAGPGIPYARLTQIAVEALTRALPPPVLIVSPPPAGTTGSTYSGTVTASGGTPPYTYTVTSGPLPPGLSLNSSTGVISGTPTTTGTYPYTVKVTDALGVTGSASYSISVTLPAPPANPANVEFILRRMYVYLRPHERIPVRGG